MSNIDDVLDPLGSRAEVEHIYRILDKGTDADQQLEVFKESGGDVKAVVDHILSQTMVGVPELAGTASL